VQAAGVLDERPLPGKRHREEERVPARVVEAFVHEPPVVRGNSIPLDIIGVFVLC